MCEAGATPKAARGIAVPESGQDENAYVMELKISELPDFAYLCYSLCPGYLTGGLEAGLARPNYPRLRLLAVTRVLG